jgi:UDP-N-acetylmuramate dehydrogenase
MEQLKKLVSFCRSAEALTIPLLIIGRGTNLLVSDKGYNGVVAQLCGDFAQVKFPHFEKGDTREFPSLEKGGQGEFENCLIAGAAVALSQLSRSTAEKGLAGLEFAFGIPGSLGGALVMNAGAGSHSIGEIVDAVEAIAQDGTEVAVHKNELRSGYRWSNLSEHICVTRAHLCMRSGSSEEITERMNQIFRKKKAEQPLSAASAGCVFKNPPGIPAGKLIDECGLKGARIGGAQVSTQHANFIVNTGGATATDVLNLIDRVRSTVRERTGIDLELELEIIGQDSLL